MKAFQFKMEVKMDSKSQLYAIILFLFISLRVNSFESSHYSPEANAGNDQFAQINEVIKLNASNSTDRDGNRLSYSWKIIQKPLGSNTHIVEPNEVAPTLTIDKSGTYKFELTISDGSNSSSIDTVSIDTYQTKPQLPEFKNQKIYIGDAAQLNGSDINDPDGDDIKFNWELMNAPKNSNAVIQYSDTDNAIIETDVRGKYSIILSVEDSKQIVKSNLFNIYAVDYFDISNRALGCVLDRIFFDGFDGLFTNSPPVADVGPDKIGVIGQDIVLDGSLSNDIDLDSLTYSWSLLTTPAGSSATITNGSEMIAGLLPDVEGDYVAQLIVNDGCLDSDPDSALVTISVNQSPEITSTPNTSVREFQPYSYQVIASDPENHDLEYELTVSPAGSTIDTNGLMTWTSLGEGTYPVTIIVTDEYGASDSQSYDLIVTANRAPVIQSFPLSSAEQDYSYSYQVVATDVDGDSISYQLNNPVAGMAIDMNGLITWTPEAAGSFQVEIEVNDGVGGTDTQTFPLEVVQLPPNPVDIAPPLSRTDFPPFIETINFLYDAKPPVQVDLDENSIQDYRVAVLKGRALGADGNPLAGVKVTIRNHPEFGYTYTREDGLYDMVVNGGGTLTVNFEKGGYLTVQRDIRTPWEDYAYSEDVVLIRLDNKVSAINLLDTSQDFQIAQGSIITDEDGTRQATLLFPSGIGATMQLGDGTFQSLSEINVRATEYTVGDLGVKRMPGELPAATGYTYAAELSVDDAIINNAVRVDFDQPIPFYVDNFLNFPIGVNVPLGSYDRNSSYWIPEKSGKVIKINRIENNLAVLDVTFDDIDNDATQQELDELNITNQELSQIASLFSAGQSFWRTRISHFTPYDCNWRYIPFPPDTAIEPPEQPEPLDPPEYYNDDSPEDEPEDIDFNADCIGCKINAQNRTLEEEIAVIGTNESLYYRSHTSSALGYNNYEIPLTGNTISPDLKRVELTILGETLEFEPVANLKYNFVWNGKDNYDRDYHSKKIRYSVDHFYDAKYTVTLEEYDRAFDVYAESEIVFTTPVTRGLLEFKTSRYNQIYLYRRFFPITSSISLNKTDDSIIQDVRNEQLKLGGWNLKSHHVYNPYQRVLLRGDGFKRKVAAYKALIDNPNVSNHPGSTNISQIGESSAVEVAPNGEIYFSDADKGHIVKINRSGEAVRVAGKIHATLSPYCNDDPIEQESALEVCLTSVQDIKIAPNGDIYYVYDRRVRKIDRNGIVSTVVGTGLYGSSPDGTPATDANVEVQNIAFDKHGTLYMSVSWGVRKIDDEGNIQTIAGGGSFMPDEEPVFDNIPANETIMFNAQGIVVSDAGSIFVADTNHECVRQISPDGWIYTINGSAPCYADVGGFRGDGGNPHEIISSPVDIELGSNGTIYILDSTPSWQVPINKITKVYPFGAVQTLIDSDSGYSGDGGPLAEAKLNHAQSFAIGLNDELYISDTYNERLRKVNLYGDISTIAGGLTDLTAPESFQPSINKNNSTSMRSAIDAGALVVVSLDGKYIYEFNDRGLHKKTVDSTTGRVYREFIYGSSGRLALIKDENGHLTQFERQNGVDVSAIISNYGKRTEFEYFQNNLLKLVKDPMQNYWEFGYTNNNQLNLFIDRKGQRYDYTYNSYGLLESDKNPIGGGWQITTPNDVEGSNQTTYITAEGREYSFYKDHYRTGIGEYFLMENTMPDATIKSHLEAIHTSNRDIKTLPDGTTITNGDSKGSRLGYQYHWDNDIRVTTPSGLEKHTWNIFANDYDGNPPDVITPVDEYTRTSIVQNQPWIVEYKQSFGQNGGYRNITPELRTNLVLLNEDKKPISYELSGFDGFNTDYDGFNRIGTIYTGIGEDKRETLFSYYDSGFMNGELESVTNPLGHVSSYEYDLNGNINKKILPDLSEIVLTYDKNDNLKTITPPGKPVHSFEYNGMNQLKTYTPPDITGTTTPHTTFEYNLDGQLTKVLRPDGRELSIGYDNVTGKIDTKTISQGVYDYDYDPITGQLETITSPDGVSIDYAYDGFLPTSTTWSGAINGQVSRTYDNIFRVSGRKVNNSNEILYFYDNDNLLVNAGSLTINRENQKGGLVNNTTIGDVETLYTYTNFGEVDVIDVKYNSNSIFTIDYTMDKLGRIDTSLETIDAVAATYDYEYDSIGRLVEVNINGVVDKTWDYDLNGNRTHENGVLIASYDSQDRLLTYRQSSFTYNHNGELETKVNGADVTSYTFDEEGLLRSVTLPDSTSIQYILDGLGRRVAKKVNGVIVSGWLYLDGLKPIAELDNSGQVVARFVYGTKTNVPSFMIKNGTTYRIISDHLGSPRKVIDVDTGVVIQEMSYDAWGNVISDTNQGFQPFGFAGGHYDSDTKLIRFGVREYDAVIGRWISKDPSLFNGKSTNLYSYAFNDPINFRDENGKIANWLGGGLAIGAIQAIFTYNATDGDIGATINGFLAGFLSGALPTLKLTKANPGKALNEITAELSDVLGGILLDVGLTLLFDSDLFIPDVEASTLEEHSIEGEHEHAVLITICGGSGDCPQPKNHRVCISN